MAGGTLPVYRMTLEEARKCQEAINEAKTKFAEYTALYKQDPKLTTFMTKIRSILMTTTN